LKSKENKGKVLPIWSYNWPRAKENEDFKRTWKRNREHKLQIESREKETKKKIWREILGYGTKRRWLCFRFTKNNERGFV